ncbi:MAG: class I SAM-dependent methyltransferase [Polyangiales bacterium]
MAPPTDEEFEAFLPQSIRDKAGRYFTPVSVARHASRLLREANARWVLDVGSGAGKFCIVAAQESPRVQFVGIEQRSYLVDVARDTAERLGVDNAHFIVGDATRAPLADFDALYFFNPFAENAFEPEDRLDETVELTEFRYFHDVMQFERSLLRAKVGTLVVTYHTFGGRIADSYQLLREELAGTDRLRLWQKTAERSTPHRYYIELDEGVGVTDSTLEIEVT